MGFNRQCMLGIGIICGGVAVYFLDRHRKKQLYIFQKKTDKLQDDYWLLNHWLELRNEGKTVVSYFEAMGWRHIAIYGMADLANRLMEELEGSPIEIDYGIDRDVCCTSARIKEIYFPEDELPETDVIVVTPYQAMDSIREILGEKVSCPVVSLEEVVWSV